MRIEHPALSGPLTDLSRLQHLLALCMPQMRASFLDQICTDLAQTRHQMDQGLAQGDATTLRRACHTMKALAGTIGATGVQIVADSLSGIRHPLTEAETTLVQRLLSDVQDLLGHLSGAQLRAQLLAIGT